MKESDPTAYINPYKKFTGIFIPDWLVEAEDLKPGAKLVYALLCRFAGKDGACYPGQATIADRLKMDPRSVRRHIKELKKEKLIEVKRSGKKMNNRYHFLWHPAMGMKDGIRISDNSREDNLSGHPPLREDNLSSGDRTALSYPYNKDIRESYKESVTRAGAREHNTQTPDSFSDRVTNATTTSQLTELWFEYRKSKNKHPTTYELDAFKSVELSGKNVEEFRRAILLSVSKGWGTLVWKEDMDRDRKGDDGAELIPSYHEDIE